jgi:acyl phosphate:glycerol-3-phosphate acyltransferase
VPLAVLLVAPVGAIILRLTRYVSLASIFGAASVPVGMIIGALLNISPPEYVVYGMVGAAIIIAKHRDNIQRLLAGTERKLGERTTVSQSSPPA